MSIVSDLKNEIRKLQIQINKIQSQCTHPASARKIEHKGSTGGWDPDTYWDEHTCQLCEKFWRTEDRP